MNEAITNLRVPIDYTERTACLGPDGSVAHVGRVFRMQNSRWKLPIYFAYSRSHQCAAHNFGATCRVSRRKMLAQHLRELESDGLVERQDFGEQPPMSSTG